MSALPATPTRHFFPRPFRIDRYAPSSEPDLDISPVLVALDAQDAQDAQRAADRAALDDAAQVQRTADRLQAAGAEDDDADADEEDIRAAAILSAAAARRHEEKLRRQRYESVQRLKTTWELLLEKYGDIAPEDDDEIDIVTGEVTVNRGRLRSLIPRDFGEASDDEDDDDEEDMFGPAVEDDDEQDGVQEAEPEGTPEPVVPPRTKEDDQDLEEFTRLENERRLAAGQAALQVEAAPLASSRPQRAPPAEPASTARGQSSAVALEQSRQVVHQMIQVQQRARRHKEPYTSLTMPDVQWSASSLPPIGWSTNDRVTPARDLSAPPPDAGPSRPRTSLASIFSQRIFSAFVEPEPSVSPAYDPPPSVLAPVFAPEPAPPPSPAASDHVSSPSTRHSHTPSLPPPPPTTTNTTTTTSATMTMARAASKARYQPRVPPPEIAVTDETPPPGLDPDAYHDKLMRTRNGVTLRYCKPCYEAGGILAERAMWCKGRFAPSHCKFYIPPEDAEPRVKKPRMPRHCKACRHAGGYRAARARRCKGRKEPHLCRFLVDDVIDFEEEEEYARQNPAPPLEPIVITAVVPKINVDALDPKMYYKEVFYTHNGTRVRRCPTCKYSGKWREDRSPWCFGRTRKELCKYSEGMVPEIRADDWTNPDDEVDATVGVASSAEQSRDKDAGGGSTEPAGEPATLAKLATREASRRPRWDPAREGPDEDDMRSDQSGEGWAASAHSSFLDDSMEEDELETEEETEDDDELDATVGVASLEEQGGDEDAGDGPTEPAGEPATLAKLATREASRQPRWGSARDDSYEDDMRSDQSGKGWAASAHSSFLDDSMEEDEAETEEETEDDDEPIDFDEQDSSDATDDDPDDEDEDDEGDDDEGEDDADQPGSPLADDVLESGWVIPIDSDNVIDPPLPGVDGTTAVAMQGRGASASASPSPYSVKSPVKALAAGVPFRPTPPSSSGVRTPLASTHRSAVQKGILRHSESERPSSSTASSARKQTRFSLVPVSRIHNVDSDSAQLVSDLEDDLLLGPDSSPVGVVEEKPRRRAKDVRESDVIRFSTETSVRAADVGFNLARHTGRVPSEMLAALAPSLGEWKPSRPTLAGAIHGGGENGYTLPTPPPSTGLDDAGSASERGNGVAGAPKKRGRPKSMSALQDRPGVWSALNLEDGQGGHKSLPTSAAPASLGARKRTRLEKTLAVVAQAVGDESLEWGLDDDVGEGGEQWREGTVVHYLL